MRKWLPSIGVLLFATSFMPAVAGASDMTVGWINKCDISHRAEDDPIVYPGQSRASHLHDFYGNRSTNASSTYDSLLGKNTTCELRRDTAAYWFPTVYFNGEPRRPYSVKFYYRSIIDPPSDVQPFPKGLKMVWGDARATGPQDLNKVWWQCDHEEHTVTPHDCGQGEHVVYHVKFPECWDGVHLDSADHRSHMSESVDRSGGLDTCPRSHPVALPRLIARLEFGFRQGSRVTLSSGFPYTLHGDFINSWHQRRLVRLVDRCINAAIDCSVLGGA